MRRVALRGTEERTGSSLIETALVMPVLLLFMAGAADFGRAYTVALEVSSAAHNGALYGVQNPADTVGMADAVASAAPDLSGSLTTTATYGCECSDGSGNTPGCSTPPTTCSANYVNYAQVKASDTYTPIFPYPGIPKSIVIQDTVVLRSGGD